jgi:catechol 2,3-dioxygenase-like lactoylglutathione lyase family enzyme
MKITGIDHVQIAVPPELETAAIEFYEKTLGLRRLPKPGGTDDVRGAWFDAGNTQLHIGVQEKGFTPASKAHPGLMVANLQAAIDHLANAGIETKPGSDLPGLKRFFAKDPAGNRLEFVQRRE